MRYLCLAYQIALYSNQYGKCTRQLSTTFVGSALHWWWGLKIFIVLGICYCENAYMFHENSLSSRFRIFRNKQLMSDRSDCFEEDEPRAKRSRIESDAEENGEAGASPSDGEYSISVTLLN